MQTLGMPGGRFTIKLSANSNNEPHPNGLEQLEFLVSANPGQPPKPWPKWPQAANCRASAWRSR